MKLKSLQLVMRFAGSFEALSGGPPGFIASSNFMTATFI